jgi:hypothetical protein
MQQAARRDAVDVRWAAATANQLPDACIIHNFYVHGQLHAIFISENIGQSD